VTAPCTRLTRHTPERFAAPGSIFFPPSTSAFSPFGIVCFQLVSGRSVVCVTAPCTPFIPHMPRRFSFSAIASPVPPPSSLPTPYQSFIFWQSWSFLIAPSASRRACAAPRLVRRVHQSRSLRPCFVKCDCSCTRLNTAPPVFGCCCHLLHSWSP
jgi:hypothetical protein